MVSSQLHKVIDNYQVDHNTNIRILSNTIHYSIKKKRGRPRLSIEQHKLNKKIKYDKEHLDCFVIYELYSLNTPKIYIGYTNSILDVRLKGHEYKYNNCKSKVIIDAGSYFIREIDRCPTYFTKQEAEIIETEWILRYRELGYDIVNKNTISTPEKIKHQVKESLKKFHESNPDYHKIYYQNRKQNNLLNPIGNRTQE
jgi:hypothetical protein